MKIVGEITSQWLSHENCWRNYFPEFYEVSFLNSILHEIYYFFFQKYNCDSNIFISHKIRSRIVTQFLSCIQYTPSGKNTFFIKIWLYFNAFTWCPLRVTVAWLKSLWKSKTYIVFWIKSITIKIFKCDNNHSLRL